MKRIIIFFLFILGGKLFSQDQLFKKDNSKYDVKVLEVTPDEIKYKLKANPNGPLYIVKKSEVALIIYENGSHETYPDAKPTVQTQTVTVYSQPYNYIDSNRIYRKRENEIKFLTLTKTKNVVFINSLDFVNSTLTFSYLREFGNGVFDIHVPVSFSFAEPGIQPFFGNNNPGYYNGITNYKITQKVIDVGLGVYINTSGRRSVTHFIGPLIRFVQYNGTFQTFSYNNYTYFTDYRNHGFVMNEAICMLNTGFLFRVTPHLNLKINAALGFVSGRYYVANNPAHFQDPTNNNNYSNNYSSSFLLGMHFGYRF